MKRLFSIASLLFFLVAIDKSSQAQTNYQPGNVLRIDFEGKHRLVDHRVVPVNRYQPGQTLRVDFEGKHNLIDRRNIPTRRYAPGPALRVDIEGLHYFRRRTNK